MRFAYALGAAVALGFAAPAQALTIDFDNLTYQFLRPVNVWGPGKLWLTRGFTVSTVDPGGIGNGVATGTHLNVVWQHNTPVELLSFDVRGTGQIDFRSTRLGGNWSDFTPTIIGLTGDWQTIVVDPSRFGYFFFLTSDATFEADNFVFNFHGIPEPSAWAMLILGFGTVGGALRRRRVFRSTAPVSA